MFYEPRGAGFIPMRAFCIPGLLMACELLRQTTPSIIIHNMKPFVTWQYLARKPKSSYKQLFVKERWIAARTLYGQTVGEDARTPEQVAADYDLPLEAVREAIVYCESDPAEIREDWDREQALIQAVGMDDPDKREWARPRILTAQERARLNRS